MKLMILHKQLQEVINVFNIENLQEQTLYLQMLTKLCIKKENGKEPNELS